MLESRHADVDYPLETKKHVHANPEKKWNSSTKVTEQPSLSEFRSRWICSRDRGMAGGGMAVPSHQWVGLREIQAGNCIGSTE